MQYKKNLNLEHLDHAMYDAKNRAILVNNTAARMLPDAAPDFFDERTAGEGFRSVSIKHT